MPKQKLTPEDIRGIKWGRIGGLSLGALAKIYGVSRTHIFRICNSKPGYALRSYPVSKEESKLLRLKDLDPE